MTFNSTIHRSEVIDVLETLKYQVKHLRKDDHEFTHGLVEEAIPLDDALHLIDDTIKFVTNPNPEV